MGKDESTKPKEEKLSGTKPHQSTDGGMTESAKLKELAAKSKTQTPKTLGDHLKIFKTRGGSTRQATDDIIEAIVKHLEK